jgi:hypothetical protein
MEKYLNKKLYACKDLGCRYSYIGTVKAINNDTVEIYNEKNPTNYQKYTLKTKDFLKWLNTKLYRI